MFLSLERSTRQHHAHHPRPIVRFTLIGPSDFVPQEPGVVITRLWFKHPSIHLLHFQDSDLLHIAQHGLGLSSGCLGALGGLPGLGDLGATGTRIVSTQR